MSKRRDLRYPAKLRLGTECKGTCSLFGVSIWTSLHWTLRRWRLFCWFFALLPAEWSSKAYENRRFFSSSCWELRNEGEKWTFCEYFHRLCTYQLFAWLFSAFGPINPKPADAFSFQTDISDWFFCGRKIRSTLDEGTSRAIFWAEVQTCSHVWRVLSSFWSREIGFNGFCFISSSAIALWSTRFRQSEYDAAKFHVEIDEFRVRATQF